MKLPNPKIYSDGIHLISDVGVEHLHLFCKEIGIKRCWYHVGRWPHYDIPKLRRKNFFEDHPEVLKVSSREIVRILKEQMF